MNIESKKTLFKGGLFAVFSFISKGIAFLLLLVLAKMMTPDEYGHLSIFNTFVTFGGFIIAFSTQGYASVSYFREKTDEFKKDFSGVLCLSVISVALMLLFVMFFGPLLEKKLEVPILFQYFAVFISFNFFVFSIHQDLYRIKEKIVNFGIFNCSFALLNCVLSIYLVHKLGNSWHGRVYGYLACSIIFLVVSLILIIKDGLVTFKFETRHLKRALYWGVPLIPHAASQWLRQGVDQYIIKGAYSATEVGIFSFALSLVNIITVIGWAFNATNSITVFKILTGDPGEKQIRLTRQIKLLFGVYFLSTVVVVICSFFATRFYFDKYAMSIQYFLILSIYGFLQCVYYIYCNYLFYYKKTKHLMYITLSCSLLHMALSFSLTGQSLYYTAIIYVCTQLLIDYLIYRQSRKLLLSEEGLKI